MKNTAPIFRNKRGFTLIELLIVISIVAIISTIGILTFVQYNRRQVLINSGNEVFSAFNLAKSRAQSQVKPEGREPCDSNPLDGYRIYFEPPPPGGSGCPLDSTRACYFVEVICSGLPDTKPTIYSLPKGLTFNFPDGQDYFQFEILTGKVPVADQNGTEIQVTNGTSAISIKVFNDGNLSKEE